MAQKRVFVLVLITLISITLACATTAPPAEPTTIAPTTVAASEEDTPEPTVVPTRAASVTDVTLGEAKQVEEGGFYFKPVAGFEVETKGGTVIQRDNGAGITVYLTGEPLGTQQTAEAILAQVQSGARTLSGLSGMRALSFAEEMTAVNVGSQVGQAIDFSGQVDGEEFYGRLATVIPDNGYALLLYVTTPSAIWPIRGLPLFDAVTQSVIFDPGDVAQAEEEPIGRGDADPSTLEDSALNSDILWRYGGPSGTEEGQFGFIAGVALDESRDRIYIADSSHGIIILNRDGEVTDTITLGSLTRFRPGGVAVGPNGNLYVANNPLNRDAARLLIFSPEGELLHEFSQVGQEPGQFGILSPKSIVVDSQGILYAIDRNEDESEEAVIRIQKFDEQGNFLGFIPIDQEEYFVNNDSPLAIDQEDNLYVATAVRGTILKMDSEGQILAVLRDDFSLDSARALGVADDGRIFLATWRDPTLIILDPKGNQLSAFAQVVEDGETDWQPGQFYWPNGLAVSGNGTFLLVSDWSGVDGFTYVTAILVND